jgi:hypothetical protein
VSLPAETRSHHTIWVDLPGGRTVALRYAADGDRLVCLGDDGLAGVPAGTRLSAAVRGLACGPRERAFWVRVEDVAAAELSLGTLADLVGDKPLGRTSVEVRNSLEEIRSTRRIVGLAG